MAFQSGQERFDLSALCTRCYGLVNSILGDDINVRNDLHHIDEMDPWMLDWSRTGYQCDAKDCRATVS